jgi:hypothetical protein
MDDPSRPVIRGVQTWARAAAVAELRSALDMPDEIVEAYVDAAALLVEAEQRYAAYVLLRNMAWPPGHSAPAAAASAAWLVLADGHRRSRRSDPTAAVPRPDWAEYATTLGVGGPAYFVHEVFDLVELRGLARPHVSVDVAQFDRAAPVVQVEASTYGAPVRLEPDESRRIAAALDEAARIVDQARAVTS